MEYNEHVSRCKKIVNSEEFSDLAKVLRDDVNSKVNRWMDWFFGFKREINGKIYDYSDCSQDHRKERHHGAGILMAGQFVAKRYGERYRELAERIAEQHVIDDFGRVPYRRELLE
jgi:hypothetical protein